MKERQRKLVKEEQGTKTQAEIDLAKSIQMIADLASNKTQPSIKGIRDNRKREQIKEHKHHMKEVMADV